MKVWWLLGVLVVMEMMGMSNTLLSNRKTRKGARKEAKKSKKFDLTEELSALQRNVSSLKADMDAMGSSRVMVHVHGPGDDDTHTHHDGGGTHVHIHMHMEEGHGCHHGHGHMDGDEHNDTDDDDHDHHGHHGHDMHGGDMKGHDMHGHMAMLHKGMEGMHDAHGTEMQGRHKHMMMMRMKMKKMKGMSKQMIANMHQHMHFPDGDEYVYGRCKMAMNPTLKKSTAHKIRGSIFFRQKIHEPLEILLHLKGFSVPKGGHSGHGDHNMHTHGFHVHEFGDLGNGCKSFGGHYNPDNVDHSGKESEHRHAGDWGNIACDDRGELHSSINDSHTSLIGPHSIVGRGVVIHENPDDMGEGGVPASLKTGNAGDRLACCVVAWSSEHNWDNLLKHDREHDHGDHHH